MCIESLSVDFHLPLSNYYDSLVKEFYERYCVATKEQAEAARKQKDCLESKEGLTETYCFCERARAAIGVTVFQALAIEAYVNLFGEYYWGDEFYQANDIKKKHSTLEKIDWICKQVEKKYPKGDIHYQTLKKLFGKRSDLVHYKPHGHTITNILEETDDPEKKCDPMAGYNEYIAAMKDVTDLFVNIDREAVVFQEVKANLVKVTGKTEPIKEMQGKMFLTMLKAMQ